MYKIELRRKAQHTLDRLPEGDLNAIIGSVKSLAELSRPRGVEKIKSAGLWRIRQGGYRIVYAIDDKESLVTIVRVGHRREIYRAL
jgi:mRNA interferase RelE/StbE